MRYLLIIFFFCVSLACLGHGVSRMDEHSHDQISLLTNIDANIASLELQAQGGSSSEIVYLLTVLCISSCSISAVSFLYVFWLGLSSKGVR